VLLTKLRLRRYRLVERADDLGAAPSTPGDVSLVCVSTPFTHIYVALSNCVDAFDAAYLHSAAKAFLPRQRHIGATAKENKLSIGRKRTGKDEVKSDRSEESSSVTANESKWLDSVLPLETLRERIPLSQV